MSVELSSRVQVEMVPSSIEDKPLKVTGKSSTSLINLGPVNTGIGTVPISNANSGAIICVKQGDGASGGTN